MKKFLLLTIFCAPLILSAQNGVAVSDLAINAGTVTFNVSWNKNNMPVALWSDTVWVFVDYNNAGKMERLPVTGATASAGTATMTPGNDNGAWIIGNARSAGSFSATVTLLTATATATGACAYASNYPPVGKYTAADKITFTGTPPYDIVFSGSGGSLSINGSDYTIPSGVTIASFTDKMGAPGKLNCMSPVIYTLSGSDVCLNGTVTLTLSGSQSGWQYQLYKGSTAIGSIVNGTGSALTFNEAASASGTVNYTVQRVSPANVQCERQVSNMRSITVNALPTNLTLTASPTAICNGQSTTLTVSATSGASYSLNNSSWQTATAFSVKPSSNASYTLYVKTAAGCSASKSNAATITVNTLPSAPAGAGGRRQFALWYGFDKC